VKSLAGGIGIALGVPFLLALALYLGTPSSGGNSFTDLAGGACVLGLITVFLVLMTALPRVAFGRYIGYRPLEQDWVWKKRQRTALWEGFKVAVAGIAAFGLVAWANHSFISSTPEHHEVRVSTPSGVTSLTLRVPHPQPDACPTDGVIIVAHRGRNLPRVSVDGEAREPLSRSSHHNKYRVPLRSERSTYSCYYDLPEVTAASTPVPVRFYISALGSAADSTPAPTRYQNGYWGWRCRALPRGDGCAVLGVLNADPASAAPSLALLVAGAAFAAIISLLVSVLLALWRGWVDDLKAISKMLKNVALLIWREVHLSRHRSISPEGESEDKAGGVF
jgi:hypothetical protein